FLELTEYTREEILGRNCSTYTFMLYFLALWKKNYGVYNFTLGCCLEISS
ncbi:hypothetical protein CISIN_1g0427723mg, partial [Citrus sinensis]